MKAYVIIALSSTALLVYCVRKLYKKSPPVVIDKDVRGKVVVITGSSSGIGKAAATELAKKGARVILACRDRLKAGKVVTEILAKSGNCSVTCADLDLSNFESIRNFVHEIKAKESKIDILINNAGVFFIPRSYTEDGFETVFQVNYLGAFYLTLLCVDLLKASPDGRVVNVSSHGHQLCHELDLGDLNFKKRAYGRFRAYSQSKLALLMFTRTLSEKLKHTKVVVNALTPGNVDTQMFRYFPPLNNPILRFIQWPVRKLIFKSEAQGAEMIFYVICQDTTGKYFSEFKEEEPSRLAKNDELAEKLWDLSANFVNLKVNF